VRGGRAAGVSAVSERPGAALACQLQDRGDGRPISIYTFTKPVEDEQPVEKKAVHKPVQKAPSMMLKVGLKQPPPVEEEGTRWRVGWASRCR
jgi:hypothetical protein